MSRITRFAVLITAFASLSAALASTAGAVTWHNTGGTAFHATGGALSLSVTGSGGTNLLTCTASTATGVAPGGTTVGATYTIPATLTYSPCTLAGNAAYIHCNSNFTGTFQPAAGITSGNADLTCVMRLTASNTALCHLGGTTPFHYTNPSGTTPGRFTLTPSSTLVMSNASGSSCSIFIGSFTSATTHSSHQTLALTDGGPVITRTA
jgi:hypothetical protein